MLVVERLGKEYRGRGSTTVAVGCIDFTVHESEFLSVVGPSGCGKTTLLKCISGLLEPSSGRVVLHGQEVREPPKDMAIVFQDYARSLYPWLTVRENVLLPLRRGKKVPDRAAVVDEALAAVGLDQFAGHYPWQLSGGMQQRVAIARAIAYQPAILLLDEPFASVDAQTRAELEDLVLRLRSALPITCLLVTHDIDEAVYMSDRVLMLTRRPSQVMGIVDVDLPHPRDQVATKELSEFAQLRTHVYTSIVAPANVVSGPTS